MIIIFIIAIHIITFVLTIVELHENTLEYITVSLGIHSSIASSSCKEYQNSFLAFLTDYFHSAEIVKAPGSPKLGKGILLYEQNEKNVLNTSTKYEISNNNKLLNLMIFFMSFRRALPRAKQKQTQEGH